MSQSRPVSTCRLRAGGEPEFIEDLVATEEPLEIRVQGRSVALTMRTPGHDEELAIGFLCTEGVITGPDDVLDLDICSAANDGPGNVIDVTLRAPESVDLARLSRRVFTSSSCGLCGKATIDAVSTKYPPIPTRQSLRPTIKTLLGLPTQLHAAQATFQTTGGLHAAALFDSAANLPVVREDVGRHNAVDKVLGRLLLDRRSPADLGLVVSGRIAFEIVQKALIARVGCIAGISAPTSLAVDLAAKSGQTLVGFLRNQRANVYTGQLA